MPPSFKLNGFWASPKFEPEIDNVVPGPPAFGENPVMTGISAGIGPSETALRLLPSQAQARTVRHALGAIHAPSRRRGPGGGDPIHHQRVMYP